jgi:hypothetical protein
MAVTLRHSFESGLASGTTITGGNSATGGNAFDTITSGTGTTATYDSTAYRASLSGLFSSAGTSAASSANWTTSIGTAVAHVYGRTVVNGSSFTVVVDFLRCRAAGAQTFRLRINSAGKLEFRNSANTLLATSTTTFATVTWYLIRWDITVGASATGVIYIHTDPTTGTAAETLTANTASFGTSNIDEVNFGAPVSAIANAAAFRHDDILFTDVALPGPPTQSIAIAETLSAADAIARAVARSRAAAETLTAGDTIARAVAQARAAAETVTAGDAIARAMAGARAAAETLSAGDAIARAVAAARTAGEGLAAADTVGRGLVVARTVAEGLAATDTVTRSWATGRAAAESLTAADTVTAVATAAAVNSGHATTQVSAPATRTTRTTATASTGVTAPRLSTTVRS